MVWSQLDLHVCAPELNGPEVEGSGCVENSVAIYESKWCQVTGNFNLTFIRYKIKQKFYVIPILKIKRKLVVLVFFFLISAFLYFQLSNYILRAT